MTSFGKIRFKFTSELPLKYGINAAAEFEDPDWPRFIRITDVTAEGKLRPETFRSLPPEVAHGFELQAGDILLARSGATVGKSFIYEPSWGEACYAGYLIRSRTSGSYSPKFIYWYLQSAEYWAAINSNLIQSTIQNFSADKYGNIRIPAPPISTQERIAQFLDIKTTKLDALIEKKQTLLNQLQEKRQAVITQAVAKGLNKDAPMKDSGIEWLGQIPAHWTVKRLNGFCDFQSGKAHEPFIDPDGAFVCVNARFISTDGQAVKMCSENLCPATLGDILMVMSDLPNGRALARSFLVDEKAEYAVNQRVCRIRPHTGNSTYLAYQLNRNLQLLAHNDGKEQTHLSNSAFLHLKLLYPPPDEQAEIAEAVTNFEASARVSEQAIERSVTLLQEYRAALITAAVTGQIEGLQ
ncbi:restriction endonuclease subunit S [Erythrobacter ani]|uniref:Restriction endonuclease subunit S n=1 Tax=Erythrobacter ani TaxID=2827235 RepID=A0ABS6SLQ5_9SPHN|nr:restriction endonuclease subunit S [Erythrobacter ani]MBV7265905.1 restriction endonuclease subunit S [Erythrobacter ani]